MEVNVGPDKDITIHRRLKDQKTANVVVRQYKRRLDDKFVLYYDLIDYDETFFYEEELVSGKPVLAKTEVERQFDANVVLWGEGEQPKDWGSNEPGAYVDLHIVPGRVERVDQNHVKYFLDLQPGKKQVVDYSVTYKRRKVRAGSEHRDGSGSPCKTWTVHWNDGELKHEPQSLFRRLGHHLWLECGGAPCSGGLSGADPRRGPGYPRVAIVGRSGSDGRPVAWAFRLLRR